MTHRAPRHLCDVAVLGPGSAEVALLLDGVRAIRSVAYLENLPPSGTARVVVLGIEPGTPGPDLAVYGGGQPAVVVFTRRPSDQDAVAQLRAGATGALVNGEFTRTDLVAAVTDARRGDAYLSSAVATAVIRHIRRTTVAPGREHALIGLSTGDAAILNAVATGATNLAIAQDLGIAVQTVRNRVSAVYAKIGVHSRAEAVAYRLSHPPP